MFLLLGFLFVFGTGYIFPAVAVWMHFGWIAGIAVLIVPVIMIFDGGCLRLIFSIAWYVFCAWAVIAVFGWWFVLVAVAWLLWWFVLAAVVSSS